MTENRTVVSISTSMWTSKRGAHIRKDIRVLRRKSTGFNILEEDLSNVGVKEVIGRIINLDECTSGYYEMVTCNETKDWETGHTEDYDYKLVKFEEDDK